MFRRTSVLASFVLAAGAIAGGDPLRADAPAPAPTTAPSVAGGPLDVVVKDIDGHDVNLADYAGKVVLIVNVASRCGFTPQYAGLEALYESKRADGLVVLGFPANDFNGQEPGTAEEIKAFCSGKYHVTFPMFAKVSVKGDDAAPLWKTLSDPARSGPAAAVPGWNFNKYLIGRDGTLIAHFPSKVKPDDAALTTAIDQALAAK